MKGTFLPYFRLASLQCGARGGSREFPRTCQCCVRLKDVVCLIIDVLKMYLVFCRGESREDS